MPPIRGHNVRWDDEDDGPPPLVDPPASQYGDGPPPLVDPPAFVDQDGPPPLVDPPSMTYTFLADMTPLTFSALQHNPHHAQQTSRDGAGSQVSYPDHPTSYAAASSQVSLSSPTTHYAPPPRFQYSYPIHSHSRLPPPMSSTSSSSQTSTGAPSEDEPGVSPGPGAGYSGAREGVVGPWGDNTMAVDPATPTSLSTSSGSFASFQLAPASSFASFADPSTGSSVFASSDAQLTDIYPPRPPSHGKKRDASYIPRPPNAFILFRSSFIRSQQVPGKVEGNHSTLSKIIGLCWKTLPTEERAEWEAKALAAQAEHRRRYPDWRFRPGSNALAKLKVKDGGGGGSKRKRDPGGGGMGSRGARGRGGVGSKRGRARGSMGRSSGGLGRIEAEDGDAGPVAGTSTRPQRGGKGKGDAVEDSGSSADDTSNGSDEDYGPQDSNDDVPSAGHSNIRTRAHRSATRLNLRVLPDPAASAAPHAVSGTIAGQDSARSHGDSGHARSLLRGGTGEIRQSGSEGAGPSVAVANEGTGASLEDIASGHTFVSSSSSSQPQHSSQASKGTARLSSHSAPREPAQAIIALGSSSAGQTRVRTTTNPRLKADKGQRRMTKEDRRLAKIAELLREGTHGEALERAMTAWDGRKREKKSQREKERHEQRNPDEDDQLLPHSEALVTPDAPAPIPGEMHPEGSPQDMESRSSVSASLEQPAELVDPVKDANPAPPIRGQGSVSPTVSASGSGSGGTADAEGEEYFSADEEATQDLVYHPTVSLPGEESESSPARETHDADLGRSANLLSRSPSFGPPPTPLIANVAPAPSHAEPGVDEASFSAEKLTLSVEDPTSAATFRTTPLTSMFKRSLSAPAPNRRSPYIPRRPDPDTMVASPTLQQTSRLQMDEPSPDLHTPGPPSLAARHPGARLVPTHARSAESLSGTPSISRLAGRVRFEGGMFPQISRGPTHVRRDTVSFPVNIATHTRGRRMESMETNTLAPQWEAPIQLRHSETVGVREPASPILEQSLSRHGAQLRGTYPNTSQATVNVDDIPLDQPPSGMQALAAPMSIRWQQEEDHTQYEITQGSWWGPGTAHEVGLSPDADDRTYARPMDVLSEDFDGAKRDEAMVWEAMALPALGYPEMGNETDLEVLYNTAAHGGSQAIHWGPSQDQTHTGLVAVPHDRPAFQHHSDSFMPLSPSSQEYSRHASGLSSPDQDSAGTSPTTASPISPSTISSFSTLTGWAGSAIGNAGPLVTATSPGATSSPWAQNAFPWIGRLQSSSLGTHGSSLGSSVAPQGQGSRLTGASSDSDYGVGTAFSPMPASKSYPSMKQRVLRAAGGLNFKRGRDQTSRRLEQTEDSGSGTSGL